MAPVVTSEFDATVERKQQRASRRVLSLSKDRTEYKKQSEVSSKTGRKGAAAPVGSDSANPHSAARAATRTCLAKGSISGSSDMPQISMGRAGSKWVRWVRKPSVFKVGDEQPSMEELEMDEYMIAAAVWDSQQRRHVAGAGDDPAVSLPVCLFQADLGDQKAFPALACMETKLVPQLLHGAWAAEGETNEEYLRNLPRSQKEFAVLEFLSKIITAELTPEKLPRNVANEAVDEVESTRKQESEHDEELTPEKCSQSAPQQQEVVDELPEDWIVVASDDASKAAASLSQAARTSFDAQHPRNVFGKKTVSKHTVTAADSQETGSGIDWSAAGMPTDMLRRFIRGSVNASHHGVQAENKTAPTPSHIMRVQNLGSSKRERSQPTTPRSHSKPRAVRQTSRGR